jgi:hypothetical protein
MRDDVLILIMYRHEFRVRVSKAIGLRKDDVNLREARIGD